VALTFSMTRELPIGYYLKKLDNLLTEGINNIHAELGINRLQWQVLNSVGEGKDVNRSSVIAILKEFSGEDNVGIAIDDLIDREVLAETSLLTLTEKGRDLHQRCVQIQNEFRQNAMQDIPEKDYLNVMRTLEKMITNLERMGKGD
jgi:hypothetical protein